MDAVSSKINQWNKFNEKWEEKQSVNPFSSYYQHELQQQKKLSKGDEEYGCPKKGSKTEYRGKKAGQHISGEVLRLLDVIEMCGQVNADGVKEISFGDLFERYTKISNTVVGLLMRARKHGFVQFQGEMLFQRRDDHTVIYLLKTAREAQG